MALEATGVQHVLIPPRTPWHRQSGKEPPQQPMVLLQLREVLGCGGAEPEAQSVPRVEQRKTDANAGRKSPLDLPREKPAAV